MRKIKFRAWLSDEKGHKVIRDCSDMKVGAINSGFYPVMQFTGLKDRNGREIYEGDIVQYFGSSPEVVDFGEITHGDSFDGGTATGYDLNQATMPGTEVIGNIYENPELLKEDK